MIVAFISIGLLATALGLLLGYAAIHFRVEGDPITDQIDALLPQTQCGQCGYPGCRPYAEAIAAGEAEINLCPPGGEATIHALADLLGKAPIPLDEERGEHPPEPLIAKINEDYCIGCTLCIQACPVDAIVGAAKQMHTVILDDCTGCNLCPPACPVDTIDMIPIPKTPEDWVWEIPVGKPATESLA